MEEFEIELSARRLDELESMLKEEEPKNLNQVLNVGLSKYKKEFFNLVKKLLMEDGILPEYNYKVITRFYLLHTDFRS